MKVAEMLRRGAILVPLDAPDLKWALTNTFRAVSGVSDELAEKLAADLVGGASGEIHRVHERVVVALAESDAVEKIGAVLGVSPVGFTADETDGASAVGATEAGARRCPPRQTRLRGALGTDHPPSLRYPTRSDAPHPEAVFPGRREGGADLERPIRRRRCEGSGIHGPRSPSESSCGGRSRAHPVPGISGYTILRGNGSYSQKGATGGSRGGRGLRVPGRHHDRGRDEGARLAGPSRERRREFCDRPGGADGEGNHDSYRDVRFGRTEPHRGSVDHGEQGRRTAPGNPSWRDSRLPHTCGSASLALPPYSLQARGIDLDEPDARNHKAGCGAVW